eukprot:gnl/MRDRNA2_/MRDRNA2_56961_c0_seq1.p1 gnl/MRDRNA2_/MRDRNA2_56961_c0~~gnl/MRDRNA2_/MRDRNA2_56961_c0_seq1.p1  ORF type:complete len:213 (+),score=20.17 gnl/MRDRNA2_/MRDRNA2_56961_c0_seq1:73-711(+)
MSGIALIFLYLFILTTHQAPLDASFSEIVQNVLNTTKHVARIVIGADQSLLDAQLAEATVQLSQIENSLLEIGRGVTARELHVFRHKAEADLEAGTATAQLVAIARQIIRHAEKFEANAAPGCCRHRKVASSIADHNVSQYESLLRFLRYEEWCSWLKSNSKDGTKAGEADFSKDPKEAQPVVGMLRKSLDVGKEAAVPSWMADRWASAHWI